MKVFIDILLLFGGLAALWIGLKRASRVMRILGFVVLSVGLIKVYSEISLWLYLEKGITGGPTLLLVALLAISQIAIMFLKRYMKRRATEEEYAAFEAQYKKRPGKGLVIYIIVLAVLMIFAMVVFSRVSN